MLPVVDKPLIQYAVEEARAAGIEQFCMVTGPRQDRPGRAFRHRLRAGGDAARAQQDRGAGSCCVRPQVEPGSMVTVRQQVPLGLGHAIWCARAFIGDDPFAILLPDDLVLADNAVPAAACRRVSRDRRQRRRGDRGAARADQPLRHPRRSARDDGRLVEVTGPGGEAGAEGCAVQPVDHRPLRADAGGDRLSRAHGAGRRRRGAADRRRWRS